jgi:hypothetical protein
MVYWLCREKLLYAVPLKSLNVFLAVTFVVTNEVLSNMIVVLLMYALSRIITLQLGNRGKSSSTKPTKFSLGRKRVRERGER